MMRRVALVITMLLAVESGPMRAQQPTVLSWKRGSEGFSTTPLPPSCGAVSENRTAWQMLAGPGPVTGSVERSAVPNGFLEVTVTRGTVHVEGVAGDRVEWVLDSVPAMLSSNSSSGNSYAINSPGMLMLGTSTAKDRYALEAIGPADGLVRRLAAFRLQVPRDLKLLHVITHCAGKVVVDGFAGELTVTSDSGDIVGTNLSGSTILEAREGGVELDLSGTPFQQGPIHLLSHDGSITVFLSPTPSVILDLTTSCGSIHSDVPAMVTMQRLGIPTYLDDASTECHARPKTLPVLPGPSYARSYTNLTLGTGAVTLRAMALQGDINLKTKAPPAGTCSEIPELGKNADGSPALATVIGRVFGPGGKTLLVGAHLRIQGTQFSTVSDRNGEYRLSFDPHLLANCASHVIVADAPGYATNTLTLQIGPKVHSDDVILASASPFWRTPVELPGEGGRPAVASDSVPYSFVEAEFEGARHPVAAAPNNPRRPWVSLAGGTRERRCVDVDKLNIARSGDFIAGPFAPTYGGLHTGSSKLIWQPFHISSPAERLTVRAARIDPTGATSVFDGFEITGNGTGTRFYPSGVGFPTTGRWLMVATAGANWGCFVITVR